MGTDSTEKTIANTKEQQEQRETFNDHERGALMSQMMNVQRINFRTQQELNMGFTMGEHTVTTGEGGPRSPSTTSGKNAEAPPLPTKLLPGMKDATDKSATAMHNDPDDYPYAISNGTGGQSRPSRGVKHDAWGHEYFRENIVVKGDLVSVGHVHKKGDASFSDPDKHGLGGAPIMKNRDGFINRKGQVEQYDLYSKGWRWFLKQDMSIEKGPFRD